MTCMMLIRVMNMKWSTSKRSENGGYVFFSVGLRSKCSGSGSEMGHCGDAAGVGGTGDVEGMVGGRIPAVLAALPASWVVPAAPPARPHVRRVLPGRRACLRGMDAPRPHSVVQYSRIRPQAEEPYYAYADCPECCALSEEEFELGKFYHIVRFHCRPSGMISLKGNYEEIIYRQMEYPSESYLLQQQEQVCNNKKRYFLSLFLHRAPVLYGPLPRQIHWHLAQLPMENAAVPVPFTRQSGVQAAVKFISTCEAILPYIFWSSDRNIEKFDSNVKRSLNYSQNRTTWYP